MQQGGETTSCSQNSLDALAIDVTVQIAELLPIDEPLYNFSENTGRMKLSCLI